jgi:uncharacterized protein YdeI (YjbR/CyaY-like superfamily)
MPARAAEHYPQVHPSSRAEWRAWLAENHATSTGVWLVSCKKATGKPRVDTVEACEEALCFGWIDSLPRKLDDERSMLLVTPRKPGSAWSAINKARAEKMIAAGLMTPAGQAVIDAARAGGQWDRLNGVEALEVPKDLKAAFGLHPGAAKHFDAFPKSARRGILEWILTARTPETRARRIEETARLAADNRRANSWPRKT